MCCTLLRPKFVFICYCKYIRYKRVTLPKFNCISLGNNTLNWLDVEPMCTGHKGHSNTLGLHKADTVETGKLRM